MFLYVLVHGFMQIHMNKGLGFIEGNWIHNTKRAGVQMGTGCKNILKEAGI